MIKDFNLKFQNKEEIDNLFLQCGLVSQEGIYLLTSDNHSLLVIGEIWKPSGIFDMIEDSEGNILQVERKYKLQGYHANIRMIDAELPEILQPFVIFPQNPMFGWL